MVYSSGRKIVKLTTHISHILWLLQMFVEDMIEEDRESTQLGTYRRLGTKRLSFFLSIVPVVWILISRARDYRILKLDELH